MIIRNGAGFWNILSALQINATLNAVIVMNVILIRNMAVLMMK